MNEPVGPPIQVVHDRLPISLEDGQTVLAHRWHANLPVRRAIVVVHGAMTHATSTASLVTALAAKKFAVFSADRRGSGEHRHLRDQHSVSLWVSDICRVISAVRKDFADITVLAWCWGSKPAVLAAVEGQVPIQRLVLLEPNFIRSAMLEQNLSKIEAMTGATLPPPYTFDDLTDNPTVKEERYQKDALRWREIPQEFLPANKELSMRSLEALPRLAIPTLCVLPKEDKLIDVPETAALMKAHRVETLPGGHAFMEDHPEHVANLIADWIEIAAD